MLRDGHSPEALGQRGASKKMAGTYVPASGSQEEPGEDPAAVF